MGCLAFCIRGVTIRGKGLSTKGDVQYEQSKNKDKVTGIIHGATGIVIISIMILVAIACCNKLLLVVVVVAVLLVVVVCSSPKSISTGDK